MVAVQTTVSSYPTSSSIEETTVAELASRLERGWKLIEDRRKRGEPVETYELHWLQLLSKYESEYGS